MAQDAISESRTTQLTRRCITLCARLTIAQGHSLQPGAHSLWSLAVLMSDSNRHITKIPITASAYARTVTGVITNRRALLYTSKGPHPVLTLTLAWRAIKRSNALR